MKQTWRKIPCLKSELQLEPTLNGGQSFRWKQSNDIWTGVFRNRVWVLTQSDDHLLYECHKQQKRSPVKQCKRKIASPEDNEENDELLLTNYLRLNINLKECYEEWSKLDENFRDAASTLYGIRMLDQEIIENLFSFICSSNNNIARISSMVEKLCKLYGTEICALDNAQYYAFPTVERLCSANVESDLRKAGFGYRAKFIYKSACMIEELGNEKWVKELRNKSYEEAKKELMKLPGIGAKVADCICLMSLGHLQAIPVDTHIFQVASNVYLPHLKTCKTVTDRVYNEISKFFQDLYGDKAGWAHTILFCSQLKSFQKGKKKTKKKQKNESL